MTDERRPPVTRTYHERLSPQQARWLYDYIDDHYGEMAAPGSLAEVELDMIHDTLFKIATEGR